jgi:GNAT superfamily N-acetyltransferase
MDVRPVRLTDPVVAPLLAGLAAHYEDLYGPNGEMARVAAEEFDPPAGLFVAVVEDGTIVAGGGFRALTPGVCEVKRMWTRPGHRRRGLASAVLGELEDRARAAGYHAVRLETGPRQPGAVAMYGGRGYRRIDTYGSYPQALAFEIDLVSP